MEGKVSVIEPRKGLRIANWAELKEYRDLFFFLVWRDIKVRYAQSVLGIGWAIIQPVFSMIVFTIIFGNLAKLESDNVPYAIFSFTALVPWTYFSGSVTAAAGVLIANKGILSKIYFPRIMLPMVSILGKLIDFIISLVVLAGLLVWFQIMPTKWVVILPLLVALMMLSATGIGMWLTALSVQYRDIKYGLQFGMQLLMYAVPVVYPVSYIPEQYRLLYAINPMVGIIEGFRSAFLATNPMPWDFIVIGTVSAVLLAVSGAIYFNKMEKVFADVA